MLTTLALIDHHTMGNPCTRIANDPEACLELADATIARHGGMGRSYRRTAVRQHLFGALWAYGRFFSPRPSWQLIDFDARRAHLRWRHPDRVVPDVVDVVAATGFRTASPAASPPDAVVRVCNLLDRNASLLMLPGAAGTILWCPADDPIHSRELAVLA